MRARIRLRAGAARTAPEGARPVGTADGALAVAVGVAGEWSAKERRPVELKELGF
jgi:hypothetical protein